jgi:hypothetical protein
MSENRFMALSSLYALNLMSPSFHTEFKERVYITTVYREIR